MFMGVYRRKFRSEGETEKKHGKINDDEGWKSLLWPHPLAHVNAMLSFETKTPMEIAKKHILQSCHFSTVF